MKLSIFPHVSPLPQTKADKADAAKQATIPETVEITTEDDLIRIVENYVWSPSIFTGKRAKSNFKSSDFAVLDIDDGLTIQEAEEIITEANYACLCLPSMSHTEEHHRFRLIFPLLRTITKEIDYVATMEDLYTVFPMADRSCIADTARLFFQSNMSDGFWIEGELLEPERGSEKSKKRSERALDTKPRVVVEEDLKELITELYGEEREVIPEAVDYFIKNAPNGLEGEWTTSLNAFTFVLSLQNVDKDTIYDLVLYLAPRGEITEKDEKTIERAYSDGEQARVENYIDEMENR